MLCWPSSLYIVLFASCNKSVALLMCSSRCRGTLNGIKWEWVSLALPSNQIELGHPNCFDVQMWLGRAYRPLLLPSTTFDISAFSKIHVRKAATMTHTIRCFAMLCYAPHCENYYTRSIIDTTKITDTERRGYFIDSRTKR